MCYRSVLVVGTASGQSGRNHGSFRNKVFIWWRHPHTFWIHWFMCWQLMFSMFLHRFFQMFASLRSCLNSFLSKYDSLITSRLWIFKGICLLVAKSVQFKAVSGEVDVLPKSKIVFLHFFFFIYYLQECCNLSEDIQQSFWQSLLVACRWYIQWYISYLIAVTNEWVWRGL